MRIAITGTTSGLGKALYDALSPHHEVISINRPEFDLSKTEDVNRIDLTNVDILINNAGHALGGGRNFKNHKQDQWIAILETNLKAPMLLTQKFINQNTCGKIVFITSQVVESALGGDTAYSASKAGVSFFAQCLRKEISPEFSVLEIRSKRIRSNFPNNRKIHSTDVLDTFYDTRCCMQADQVAHLVRMVLDTNIVEVLNIGALE